jgi:hypothetical protein
MLHRYDRAAEIKVNAKDWLKNVRAAMSIRNTLNAILPRLGTMIASRGFAR